MIRKLVVRVQMHDASSFMYRHWYSTKRLNCTHLEMSPYMEVWEQASGLLECSRAFDGKRLRKLR
jgi:hypothetical protein